MWGLESDVELSRVDLETTLDRGRALIVGEPGVASASRAFLEKLGALQPVARRVAWNAACVSSWPNPSDIPDCYRHGLAVARAEALEQYGTLDEVTCILDRLFAEDPRPISEAVLRQIAPLTPTARQFMLVFACYGLWADDREHTPSWLIATYHHTLWAIRDEARALGRPS